VLAESVTQIHVKHIRLPSKRDELFYTMKVAARGSIRRAPNALSWVEALHKMSRHADPGDVIRGWNSQSGSSDQIKGNKAQAVKNVLEMDPQIRGVLLSTVSEMGWEGWQAPACQVSGLIVGGWVGHCCCVCCFCCEAHRTPRTTSAARSSYQVLFTRPPAPRGQARGLPAELSPWSPA